MQAYMGVAADLRAALSFVRIAWRRAWWVLIPTCVAWSLAVSPNRGLGWTSVALAFALLGSAELYRIAPAGNAPPLAAAVGRLAIVWILTLAFFAVLGSLLFVLFLSSAYAVASAGAGFDSSQVRTWGPAVDARGRVVLAVVAVFGLSLLAWAMTRIALASAATVAVGRVRVLSAWPLTRRFGWSLLFARLVIGVPTVGLAVLAINAQRVSGASAIDGAWMLSALAGTLIGGVWLPLNTGFMTYIFQSRAYL